jgi:hypothetical protein
VWGRPEERLRQVERVGFTNDERMETKGKVKNKFRTLIQPHKYIQDFVLVSHNKRPLTA